MKSLYFSLISMLVISIPLQAQILNGGFEDWDGSEPVDWVTNNVFEFDLFPITQTSDVHSGALALKGEVLKTPNPPITYSPFLVSGSDAFGFSFSGRPDTIRGYYKFNPVGGDGLMININLLGGGNLLGFGGDIIYTPTGPNYQEAVFNITYFDSVTIPDKIELWFQILPAGTFANVGTAFYLDDFPTMKMLKPSGENGIIENLVFIAGETDTIKWDGGGALNVDIEYSVDNGTTYQQIVSNYPADSTRYFWAVPGSLLTREAKIRLKESENINNEIKSIEFSIKPWQLTRIDANDKFELFKPNEDGWLFSNARSNVWPQSWWQQFDYRGTDPITNEDYPFLFPFINADSSDFPDWPLFVDVFGQENCYLFGNSYKSEATTHWGGIFSGIRDYWDGSCFGFAVSSLLGFYHNSSLVQRFPNIGSFTNLFNVPLNNDSRYIVNYFFTHQFGAESRATKRARLNSYTPRELLQDLKDMFRKENGDGRSLAFYNNQGSGGHAVTPYKLERVGTSSTFNLRVYDNRSPSNMNSIIFIDSSANQWTDNTGLLYQSGMTGCYLRRESVNFLSRPTIPDAPDQRLSAFKSPNGSSNMTIYNTTNANIIITSSNGDQIGFQDSIAFGDIPNSIPLIPETTSYQPPIGYDLPQDSYSLQINNFTDSSSYVFFLADSIIYNYRRFDANNNEVDELNFSENGIGIINPDPNDKNMILETIILEDSTSEKIFVTSNVKISAGDSIRIREKDRNELLLQNYGESMSYDLQTRFASESGQAVFFHMAIPMDQNSAHQIVPDWNDLINTPIIIYIDLGNDGTIDDTLMLKNQITGIDDQSTLGIPDEYQLAQNYPNPFNPITKIRYSLPQQSNVSLIVYNVLSQEVITLVNDQQPAGNYEVSFDAANLSSGIYFYKLQAGSFVETKKMVLMK